MPGILINSYSSSTRRTMKRSWRSRSPVRSTTTPSVHRIRPESKNNCTNDGDSCTCSTIVPLLKKVSPNTPEMPRLIHEDRKKVRFKERDLITIVTVASHRDFTSSECLSVWYNPTEYREFALKEIREMMNAPLLQRKEEHQKSHRINHLRRGVLHSQSDRRLQRKLRRANSDYSQWLADFCMGCSDSCVTEARQRGMENDLELLNIKIRELTERQQPLARTIQLSKIILFFSIIIIFNDFQTNASKEQIKERLST